MHILLYTTEFPPYNGGIATFSHAAARGLQQCGAAVTVIAPAYGPQDREYDERAGFKVQRMRGAVRFGPAACRFLLGHALLRPPDALFLANVKAQLHVATLGPVPVPVAAYLHGAEVTAHFADELEPVFREQVRRFYREAAVVMANSRSTADLFAQYRQHHRREADVVYMGIDPDRLLTADGEPSGGRVQPAGECGATVLCVARLSPEKGHATLLRAFARVQARVPRAVLRLAGDGPCRMALESLVRELGLPAQVQFLGDLGPQALRQQYASCDVFAVVGQLESFGLTFLEANLFGKPVVAARVGGAPEAVVEGVTGLLVNPGNDDEVAAAISALLLDPQRAQAMGCAGRERVLREFTHIHMARRILEHLRAPVPPVSRARVRAWAAASWGSLTASAAVARCLGPRPRRATAHIR
jgi:phosphatidylinositol alpha-1,6-mannosyltransferase